MLSDADTPFGTVENSVQDISQQMASPSVAQPQSSLPASGKKTKDSESLHWRPAKPKMSLEFHKWIEK